MNRLLTAMACLFTAAYSTYAQTPHFQAAKPVWPQGRETELNVNVGFRATFEAKPEDKPVLRITAATVYRAFISGTFLGYGPARGPHGWFRVDEWDLSDKLTAGQNVVAVEVAGYNTNSFYLLDQPSFFQGEVTAGNKVLAATGGTPVFAGQILDYRVQKVERYSFQRPYSEAYRLTPTATEWRTTPTASFTEVTCPTLPEKQLISRRIKYPDFSIKPASRIIATGTVTEPSEEQFSSMTKARKNVKAFPEDQIEIRPSAEMSKRPNASFEKTESSLTTETKYTLARNAFAITDFGTNFTGFLGIDVTCTQPTRLLLAFDEILNQEGDVDPRRLGCVNVVVFDLAAGQYTLETFEPYTCRYLKIVSANSPCEISNIHLRQYVNNDIAQARFNTPDNDLNRLFKAGTETFVQNALDIFMDCPHRERAGWLCDSFFTARVAKDLSGNTLVEKNFLENFLLPESYPNIPKGMLPMCYPSDHVDGVYIPNWAMWFVVQLDEYLARSGDRELVDALKPKVLTLLDFFKKYENTEGLLEKLESWVFVEWSKANDFCQDVNYPSNMLYAGVLSAAGHMYNLPELSEKAEKIRETIRKQSFDGEFFVDNAIRKEGKLEVTQNHTEVCQYFAFYFNIATPDTHAELWRKLRDQFGPKRIENKLFPEVYPANSFIGNMLRVEILSRNGYCQQILDESKDYLLYMADRTGTLWENTTPTASCDHGFASHIVHTLYRDILGLRQVDTVHKTITLRFGDVKLPSCEGVMPTPDGPITLKWRVEGEKLIYSIQVPTDYTVNVEETKDRQVVKE